MSPIAAPAGGWKPRRISAAERMRIARAHLPAVDGHPERESEAAGFVNHLCISLVFDLDSAARSTSSAEERERLKDIATTAKKLARLLRQTDVGGGLAMTLMRRRPRVASSDLPWNGTTAAALAFNASIYSPGRHPLELLADAARTCEAELAKRASGAGRARLHQRLHGDPRLQLCEGCAALLLRYGGPKAAPATADGTVYRFACAIWEAATGRPSTDSGLENFTKQGANRARKLQFAA